MIEFIEFIEFGGRNAAFDKLRRGKVGKWNLSRGDRGWEAGRLGRKEGEKVRR